MARETPAPLSTPTARPPRDPERVDSTSGPAASSDAAGTEGSLPCPSCGVDLAATESFERLRVCPSCHRHFPLPARERLHLLVDEGSFLETNAALVSVDPLVFRDLLPVPDRLAEAREHAPGESAPEGGVREAVVTGIGEIEGRQAVLVILDHAYLGGGIGLVAGEKIVLAMELAEQRGLPLVVLCAAGGARTRTGLLSLAQLAKVAASATRLHRAGIPFVAMLAHPTTGSVYVGLANQADIILAEPGAQIGFAAGRGRGVTVEPGAETNPAEFVLAHGLIDGVVDRARLRDTLATLLHLFADRGAYQPLPPPVPPPLHGQRPVWEEAALARHPDRPAALHYLRRIVSDFVELHGDRATGDDPAIICGLGRVAGRPVAVIAQHRPPPSGSGSVPDDPHPANVGPAGYRKAIRIMRLAGHLELPIVSLIDTPGTAEGLATEAGGIGVAVAQALGLLSMLPVPIVAAIVGEGGGVGTVALGTGDRTLMQSHAIYSPAGSALPMVSVVPGGEREQETAEPTVARTLTAHDCRRLGVVDVIVPEPAPAAHADPGEAARLLEAALARALAEVSGIGPRRLLDQRARRLRCLGQSTPAGREAARREVRELQELQRMLVRSFGDLRERWEGRTRGKRPFPARPRPDLTDLANRVAGGVRGRGGDSPGGDNH